MAQSVKCFLSEHEDLNLTHSTCVQMPAAVVPKRHLSAGMAETGTSLGLADQPFQKLVGSRFRETMSRKSKVEGWAG